MTSLSDQVYAALCSQKSEATTSTTSTWRCLFCNNEEARKDCDNEPTKLLFTRDSYNKSADNLETQLSVFFMLRNVLGLPNEFLEELLKEYGSPALWRVQLCRPCKRLFTEAEYLWDKIKALQKELKKATYDIKDLIVNSISPEEGEALVKHSDDLDAHKAVIKEQLKSHKVPVPETIRATFFLCLHEQSTENEAANKCVVFKTVNGRSSTKSKTAKLDWHDTGIPFLAFADFERKMKEFSEVLTSVSKSAPNTTVESESTVKPLSLNANEVNDDDNDDDITILDDASQSSGKLSSSSETTLPTASSNKGPRTVVQTQVPGEEEPEEPSIRIVQTSSLMERDEVDSEDEAAVPRVLGIIKRDINDMDDEMETEDPLGRTSDQEDPDYAPSAEGLIRRGCNAPSENGVERNPENYPSKLKSKTIIPVKMGENFQCGKCSAEFETRSGCQSHILKDHYAEKHGFHCHICSAKFDLHLQMTDHVAKFHGSVRTPYDNSFNPDTDYVGFKRQEKDDAGKYHNDSKRTKSYFGPIFECPVPGCDKKFEYKSRLNNHAKAVHDISLIGLNVKTKLPADALGSSPDSQGLFCHHCSEKGILFKAATKDVLDIHLKMRHAVLEKNVEPSRSRSPKTMKKVVAKKKLTARVTKPLLKKPSTMKCPDCQLVLPTASAIVEHLKNPDNKCPDCPKHFLFDMDLKRHLELDHADRRAFQCPYCPKSFSAQTIYEKHIDNHQTFDVHECEVCHEKLTGFSTFTNHMESQHGYLQNVRQDPEIFGF